MNIQQRNDVSMQFMKPHRPDMFNMVSLIVQESLWFLIISDFPI